MKQGLSTFFVDPCFSSSLAELFKLSERHIQRLYSKGPVVCWVVIICKKTKVQEGWMLMLIVLCAVDSVTVHTTEK